METPVGAKILRVLRNRRRTLRGAYNILPSSTENLDRYKVIGEGRA